MSGLEYLLTTTPEKRKQDIQKLLEVRRLIDANYVELKKRLSE